MDLNIQPIKSWFGFSRSERRSSFIMLLIIILIIGVRYVIPDSRIDIEYITDTISAGDDPPGRAERTGDISVSPIPFDPNTASHATLIKAGLAEKEANTLINYRKKGGIFRQPSDIKKVYGIEDAKAEKLIPFVKLNQSGLPKADSHPVQKNSRIDINTSDSVALLKLPGIGPVLSSRIIRYRRLLGGFARIEQLKEVYGLPVETYETIRGRVFADSTVITRININSAVYKELIHIPYFEKYEVSAILKYRELKGRIRGISDLTENKLITIEKAYKVGPYLKYSE